MLRTSARYAAVGAERRVASSKLRSLSLLSAAVALFGTIAPLPASAVFCNTWTNTAGGDWSVAGNWSAGVPTAGSVVCITMPGTYTVEITAADGTETIGGLTIGAGSGAQTLQIDAGAQLTANGTSTNQAGGVIANQGTFLVGVNQVFNQEFGTTSGNAITINGAYLNFTGTGSSSFTITSLGFSIMTGNTLFSVRMSANAKLSTYGELMTQFKQEHNATIVAVADDALGNGLSLNAPASKHVGPDQVIYYIAERRIAHV